MIPQAAIVEWRNLAPWPEFDQVEQDLVLSRALLDIFANPILSEAVAFRGGTALSKLYLPTTSRFSEDIDLVLVHPKTKISKATIFEELRKSLDSWLGTPRRDWTANSITVVYRYEAEAPAGKRLRLKIEINTREHFSCFGYVHKELEVRSRWVGGNVKIRTYSLEELLGTKLRALYQRRKGRDLFDLWCGLTVGKADPERIVEAFNFYLEKQGLKIAQEKYINNLDEKLETLFFLKDTQSLIPSHIEYDAKIAGDLVRKELLRRLG
jgi:predicted nucleotidyltransferase component of viral defense system